MNLADLDWSNEVLKGKGSLSNAFVIKDMKESKDYILLRPRYKHATYAWTKSILKYKKHAEHFNKANIKDVFIPKIHDIDLDNSFALMDLVYGKEMRYCDLDTHQNKDKIISDFANFLNSIHQYKGISDIDPVECSTEIMKIKPLIRLGFEEEYNILENTIAESKKIGNRLIHNDITDLNTFINKDNISILDLEKSGLGNPFNEFAIIRLGGGISEESFNSLVDKYNSLPKELDISIDKDMINLSYYLTHLMSSIDSLHRFNGKFIEKQINDKSKKSAEVIEKRQGAKKARDFISRVNRKTEGHFKLSI